MPAYRPRTWWGVAVAALVAAACKDTTSPRLSAPAGLTNDVQTLGSVFTTALFQSYQAVSDSIGAMAPSLRFGGELLQATSPTTPAEVGRVYSASPQRAQALKQLAIGLAGTGTSSVIPDTLWNSIFAWDPNTHHYYRQSTTGGPDHGVRFLLYAIDPITHQIVESPLTVIGYVDLIDVAGPRRAVPPLRHRSHHPSDRREPADRHRLRGSDRREPRSDRRAASRPSGYASRERPRHARRLHDHRHAILGWLVLRDRRRVRERWDAHPHVQRVILGHERRYRVSGRIHQRPLGAEHPRCDRGSHRVDHDAGRGSRDAIVQSERHAGCRDRGCDGHHHGDAFYPVGHREHHDHGERRRVRPDHRDGQRDHDPSRGREPAVAGRVRGAGTAILAARYRARGDSAAVPPGRESPGGVARSPGDANPPPGSGPAGDFAL